ncbi:MAG: glycosyltransferase [Candidatus Omnitrophota bacterium]
MKSIIAAGGSYGHFYPALSLARALKDWGADVTLVTDRRVFIDEAREKGISARFVGGDYAACGPLRRLWLLLRAVVGCLSVLAGAGGRGEAVLGFGGYVSFSLVFAAAVLRRALFWRREKARIYIHEQNALLGRANRVAALFADKIFISFPETAGRYKNIAGRMILSGNPVRPELKVIDKGSARRHLGLAADVWTLLVVGGSRGARRINREVARALGLLSQDIRLQVIHLCGRDNLDEMRRAYGGVSFKNRLFGFYHRMSYPFSAADLVVCRAGASTISEIGYFGLAAIFIPYPYARGHQKENAKVLTKQAKSVIIEERDLRAEALAGHIRDFIRRPPLAAKAGQRPKHLDGNAAQRIAEEVSRLKTAR